MLILKSSLKIKINVQHKVQNLLTHFNYNLLKLASRNRLIKNKFHFSFLTNRFQFSICSIKSFCILHYFEIWLLKLIIDICIQYTIKQSCFKNCNKEWTKNIAPNRIKHVIFIEYMFKLYLYIYVDNVEFFMYPL